jgi:hypothetical protein
MASDKSTDPAVILTPELPPVFRQLLGQMSLEATAEDNEFGSPMVTSVVKILSAKTEEEMWEADDLAQTGGRDLIDVEQTIIAYAIKWSNNPTIQSAFKDEHNRGMYLLIRSVRMETGEEFIWNTSAPLLVGKIMWLANRELLPYSCVIKGTDLGAGQAVLKLKRVPARATQGTLA